MRIRNCLDTAGVYNIRQAFTSDICYRISWAIIDDGRSFFSTVLIQHDFTHGNVRFPETLIDSILPEVRYANPIMRANYPKEWQPKQARAQATSQTLSAKLNWSPPDGTPTQHRSGGGTAPQQQKANAPFQDQRHPLIVKMMAPYIAKLGDNVYVGELFDAAGVRTSDMPIPTGTRFASPDGTKTYLCWNAVLGRCKFGKVCKYRRNHPGANEIPTEYAEKVVALLKSGVDYVVSTKEPTTKKIKSEVIVA